MNLRLGLVVRIDNSGLGYQTRALEKMLSPSKVMYLDKDEIPSYEQYIDFLQDLDVMLTCETPYIYEAWNWARNMGVKTICQPNWEFFDGLVQPNMPHPDRYIMPSYWHLGDMHNLFPNTIYLPPPTEPFDRDHTASKKRRFVHIVGHNAIYDRNGWVSIMDALPYTKSDFELTVFSQQDMTGYSDPRVKYNVFDVEDQSDLYHNFDVMLLPRRYGGLCLPMNEALAAGLPVIMTDTDPNNMVLPKDWLLPAQITGSFEGRSTIDVYSVNAQDLAKEIDRWCELGLEELEVERLRALAFAEQYSFKELKPKYELLLSTLVSGKLQV